MSMVGRFGTLGIIIPSNGVPTALSCAHVMIDPNKGEGVGQGVIQPSYGEYPADAIGEVSLYHYGNRNVDAALVPITNGRDCLLWNVEHIGKIDKWSTVASVGDWVEKFGAMTQYTSGTIDSTTFTATIPSRGNGDITLDDMITIKTEEEPFSMKGDSGAAVIDAGTKKMVGMVVAGIETADGHAISVCQNSAYLQQRISISDSRRFRV